MSCSGSKAEKVGEATGGMKGKKTRAAFFFFNDLSLAIRQTNGKDDQRDVPL